MPDEDFDAFSPLEDEEDEEDAVVEVAEGSRTECRLISYEPPASF